MIPRREKGFLVLAARERRMEEPWAPVAPKTVMSLGDIAVYNWY